MEQREKTNGAYVYSETLTPEQRAVIAHEQGNILVTASAGSGKTFTIIERAKRLIIEKKATVKEILAVTFTEKAALEMKEKLKSALYERIAEGKDDKLVSQLNDIAVADISTLHSFCAKLIRTYFYIVGVSPDFKIIDEGESTVLREESINKTFKEFYDSGEEWFRVMVDKYAVKRTDTGLKDLIIDAYSFCATEAYPERIISLHQKYLTGDNIEVLEKKYLHFFKRKVLALRPLAEKAMGIFKKMELTKSYALAERMYKDLDTIFCVENVSEVEKFNPYPVRLDFDRNLEGEAIIGKEMLTVVKNKLKKYLSDCVAVLKAEGRNEESVNKILTHTERFVEILQRFSDNFAEIKREENALDFNDLEHFALKILQDEQIRKEIAEKYIYIFVDEYQDVNDVQEEILSKVASNNMLMVGDTKQSIYGFRGCRPEIFSNKEIDMKKSGQKTVRLNDNFRSAVGVIDCVNKIFDYCMTEEFFDENYKDNSRLKFGNSYPAGMDGRANLHVVKKVSGRTSVSEEPRIYDVLEEADKIFDNQEDYTASVVTDIINSELGKKYYDVKEKEEKIIGLGDVVILTRSRNSEYVRRLVKGLNRHGIDVISEVEENVCDFPEIALLLNALRLADCFYQDIPLASVLKSPIGNFNDDELFEVASFAKGYANNFCQAFSYYLENAKTPLRERLKAFKEYFDDVRFYSDFTGAKGVLEKLITDNGLESCFLSQRNGKVKVQRMRRFIAVGVKEGRTLTVREFLKLAEGAGARSVFNFSESGEKDAVTIMTIHASKGLEFPVVIACGMERSFNSEEERDEIYFDREYGFGSKVFDEQKRIKEETLIRAVIKEKMRAERVKEEMRLFYVALTRAKYSLHLTIVGKKDERKDVFSGAEKFIDYIPSDMEVLESKESDYDFINLTKGTRKVIIGAPDQTEVSLMKDNFSWTYKHKEDTALPLKTDVTSATVSEHYRESNQVIIFSEDETGVERGNIAHKIMEHFDFSSTLTVIEQAENMVERGIIGEQELSEINCDRLQKALDSGAFEGVKGKSLYREKGFIVGIEGDKILDVKTKETVLLQGIIDLLVIDGDKAEIIDYKYSLKGVQALKERYTKQLELYAYAVEKALGKVVTKKTLVNLYSGEIVPIL